MMHKSSKVKYYMFYNINNQHVTKSNNCELMLNEISKF